MTCGFNCGVKDHDEFVFFDFAPHLFRRVRRMSSISNFEYARALQSTKREKFSEGASGAFLYFSDDERFIVKTTQLDEISVLIEMLEEYVEHLERNPNSLVTRFLGCHAIRMYGHTMYFVVINNVLTSHGKSIHERYDLKGSWVNRHHKPTVRGRMTECRHCNQKFRVGDPQAQCPARVNRSHAPNTVMKDNDLKTKLRIHPSTAAAIAEQISRDVSAALPVFWLDFWLVPSARSDTMLC
jgi:1-phosphatidylinositol-4-phosphate 5-kinase